MKVAIIGYGKMGQLIEQILLERGHTVSVIIDKNSQELFDSEKFKQSEVAIEFSTPQTALANIRRAWQAGVKVVCGTTGWTEHLPSLKEEIERGQGTLFWASNFSLGVNLFFEINRRISELMRGFDNYSVGISETHHIHKKDAPSGTAITLAERIAEARDDVQGWTLLPEVEAGKIPIEAIREGEVFGIHTARYESQEDVMTFTHEAKSRRGFALGAVMAAEFLHGRQGFFTMKDMLGF